MDHDEMGCEDVNMIEVGQDSLLSFSNGGNELCGSLQEL
jgi:hypothetical protein